MNPQKQRIGTRGRIPIKLDYNDFEEFYTENPGLTVNEMAEITGVTTRCIYYKLQQYDLNNASKFDVRISRMMMDAYRKGVEDGEERGFLIGAGLGVGVGDLLKSNGIGISDFIAGLSKVQTKK